MHVMLRAYSNRVSQGYVSVGLVSCWTVHLHRIYTLTPIAASTVLSYHIAVIVVSLAGRARCSSLGAVVILYISCLKLLSSIFCMIPLQCLHHCSRLSTSGFFFSQIHPLSQVDCKCINLGCPFHWASSRSIVMALSLVEQKQKQNTVWTVDEVERPWIMAVANASNSLGIHLGSTHLTAAEVTVRGNHLVPVARISGGIEYRQENLRTLGSSY